MSHYCREFPGGIRTLEIIDISAKGWLVEHQHIWKVHAGEQARQGHKGGREGIGGGTPPPDVDKGFNPRFKLKQKSN